jgi:hypothetical protein
MGYLRSSKGQAKNVSQTNRGNSFGPLGQDKNCDRDFLKPISGSIARFHVDKIQCVLFQKRGLVS